MDLITTKLSQYISDKGINVSKMARDTGLPYTALYDSLLNTDRDRNIRGKELLGICDFLGIDPRDFANKKNVKKTCSVEYEEIQVLTYDDELIASITEDDVIVKGGYKVVCVPVVS